MGLKTYSLRLDEEEFEKLRNALSEYGDPDLNMGYIIRAYIRDLTRLSQFEGFERRKSL